MENYEKIDADKKGVPYVQEFSWRHDLNRFLTLHHSSIEIISINPYCESVYSPHYALAYKVKESFDLEAHKKYVKEEEEKERRRKEGY